MSRIQEVAEGKPAPGTLPDGTVLANGQVALRLPGHREGLELLKNRYFLLGIGVQKGTPILIMPLAIAAVGVTVYSEYALLYTVVQTVAVLAGLGVPQALAPFWYDSSDKGAYVGSLTALMLLVQALLSVPLGIVLYLALQTGLQVSPAIYGPLVVLYAVAYNLNSLALNLICVQLKQATFFFSTLLTAGLLVGMIVLIGRIPGDKLFLFTAVNLVALFLQSICYLYFSRVSLFSLYRWEFMRSFTGRVLKFTGPLTVYTMIALLGLVVDKWMVKLFFPSSTFAQYVLDFQFAFSVTLLSVVIGMYNSPKLCQLVHDRAGAELRRNLLGNYALSFFGSFVVAAAAFSYARIGGIHLSPGYWVLTLGFALNNCYAVNSSLLAAQKRSRTLALIGATSAIAFVLALLACGWAAASGLVYAASASYYLLLVLLSMLSLVDVFQARETPPEVPGKLGEIV